MKNDTDTSRIDRRIQRTKDLLSDALIALILEKGYDATTIQDITERANVGRSTFYAHFENKEQLLFGNKDLKNLPKEQSIDFLTLYRHIVENARVAKAILKEQGGEVILRYMQEVIAHRLAPPPLVQSKSIIIQRSHQSPSNRKMKLLLAEATASALVRLIVCWVEQDMPCTPEEISELSNKILQSIMKTEGEV